MKIVFGTYLIEVGLDDIYSSFSIWLLNITSLSFSFKYFLNKSEEGYNIQLMRNHLQVDVRYI
jgi:hypothetical protein